MVQPTRQTPRQPFNLLVDEPDFESSVSATPVTRPIALVDTLDSKTGTRNSSGIGRDPVLPGVFGHFVQRNHWSEEMRDPDVVIRVARTSPEVAGSRGAGR